MSASAIRVGRQLAVALVLAAAAVVFLAFVTPAGLYLGNRLEFTAPLPRLMLQYVPFVLPLALAGACLGALLPRAAFARASTLIATLLVLLWLQGNILIWDYGVLDGRAIDWSRNEWRGWLELSLWIGVLLLSDAFRARAGRTIFNVSIALVLVQASVVAISFAGSDSDRQQKPPASDDVAGAMSEFSGSGDVLHIIADGFQSDVFHDLLVARPGGERVQRAFDGFVFARDHLGAYLYTHMSVPALLSGQLYTNQEPREAFLARAMGHQSILAAAHRAGYDVEIAAPAGALPSLYRRVAGARLLEIPVAEHANSWRSARDEALLLADLTLFRLLPHHAKRLVYNEQSWFLQLMFGSTLAEGATFFAHNALLRELAAKAKVGQSRPTYKLLHLMLSHNPMVAAPNCRYAGTVLPGTRSNVQVQAGCSLASIAVLLDRLRTLGIYDESTIVVTGDHGTWLAPEALKRDEDAKRRLVGMAFSANYVGQAMPLLLFKPPRAHGPVQVVESPTWIVDTAATIAEAAHIPGDFSGTSVLRTRNDVRPRRFLAYDYTRDEWLAPYLSEIREFIVTGPVQSDASWSRGETFAPPEGAAGRGDTSP